GVLRPLSHPPAGRLQLRLLSRRKPPRRRGPDRADVPAGLSSLRARPARVAGTALATMADPHRPQPRREPLPRPLAQAGVADRRDRTPAGAAHDRAAGGGTRGAEPGAGRGSAATGGPARGAD